ncbi:MAG: hypothetical protein RIS26_196 [Actinomycetota bacterium]
MIKKLLSVISIAVLAVSLTGCSNPVSKDDVYNQDPHWVVCENNVFQCGSIKVPMDWENPTGSKIEIKLVRKFVNNAIGSLVLNPGGPGGSGYDFLVNNYSDIGTQALRDSYSFVSFDPRGVSRSSAVKCYDAAKTDELLYGAANFEPGSPEDLKESRAEMAQFAKACKQNTGDVLGHVDTVSAAKDMDVIRAVLGEDKLDYLGFSYGTFLGTTYAALFPEKVGRFVLDGAIDPRVSDEQQSLNQLKGFSLALDDYLKDCLKNQADCPFHGSFASAQAEVRKFLRDMETKKLPTGDGRKLTGTAALTGLIMALYSDDYWPYLTDAFNQAFAKDGTTFIQLADFYNDRTSDGRYSGNSLEANIAVNCLDSRSSADPSAMAAQNQRLLATAPILGRYWQNGAVTCEAWPYPVVKRPESYAAKGAPTILVVGTTGDPATPFEQSVALAHDVLAKGFLITFKGEGHTAYGRSNECVSSAVDGFLIDGNVPSSEPIC